MVGVRQTLDSIFLHAFLLKEMGLEFLQIFTYYLTQLPYAKTISFR